VNSTGKTEELLIEDSISVRELPETPREIPRKEREK